eukprot:3643564-Alexandrium_andersonii.AAC.1
MEDIAERRLPHTLLGDVNGLLEDVLPIREALEHRRLWDSAAAPHLTGQVGPIMTCQAHGSAKRTRWDYILISTQVPQLAKRVWARFDAGYDVHAPVRLELSVRRQA